MSSLTEFFHAEGMEILPEIGGRAVSTPPTAESYVIRHGQAGLHWHTSNGDHYATCCRATCSSPTPPTTTGPKTRTRSGADR